MKLSPLAYALIGLAAAEPQTGYRLRQVFETTPLGSYSSSPGSIYPALTKLVKAGLLVQKLNKFGKKQLYHVTKTGTERLNDWLREPVSVDEIANHIDHALLRFAFLANIEDQNVSRDFLLSFQNATNIHLNNLKMFMESPESQALTIHGRLAMDNGIRNYEAHLSWAQYAYKEFTQ